MYNNRLFYAHEISSLVLLVMKTLWKLFCLLAPIRGWLKKHVIIDNMVQSTYWQSHGDFNLGRVEKNHKIFSASLHNVKSSINVISHLSQKRFWWKNMYFFVQLSLCLLVTQHRWLQACSTIMIKFVSIYGELKHLKNEINYVPYLWM